MTDFTIDGLLYPLTKGDFFGHKFHGNQYTEGVAEHVKAGEKAEKLGMFRYHNGRWAAANQILAEAADHFATARDLEAKNGGDKVAELDARAKKNAHYSRTAQQIIEANKP